MTTTTTRSHENSIKESIVALDLRIIKVRNIQRPFSSFPFLSCTYNAFLRPLREAFPSEMCRVEQNCNVRFMAVNYSGVLSSPKFIISLLHESHSSKREKSTFPSRFFHRTIYWSRLTQKHKHETEKKHPTTKIDKTKNSRDTRGSWTRISNEK